MSIVLILLLYYLDLGLKTYFMAEKNQLIYQRLLQKRVKSKKVGLVKNPRLLLISAKQRDELEGSLADLYTSCEFVEKALTHGSDTEILLVKKQVETSNPPV